jgi:hypothetical protein
MKQTIYFILISIIPFVSNAQERTLNSDKTFSIEPINEWENYSKNNSIIFAKPLKNTEDVFQENIQFNVYPADGATLQQLWNSWILQDFPNSFERFKIIKMWDSNVNDYEAKWIEFTNTANELNYRNLVYLIMNNDMVYYIIGSSLDQEFNEVEHEFRLMINSFRIEYLNELTK